MTTPAPNGGDYSADLIQYQEPQHGLTTFSRENVELLKTTIARGATDAELALFLEVCKRKNLDPFSKQIHLVKRWNPASQRDEATFQVGIDGYRAVAERTGRYEGQDGPYWCGDDGAWRDVWLSPDPPIAAKAGVFKRGFRTALYGVALYSEYIQRNRAGHPNSMWSKMPANQLAKCAESLALRKAFPEELSGIYTTEEMEQAEYHPEPTQSVHPAPLPAPPQSGLAQSVAPPANIRQMPQPVEDDPAVKLATMKTAICRLTGVAPSDIGKPLMAFLRGYLGLAPNAKVSGLTVSDWVRPMACLLTVLEAAVANGTDDAKAFLAEPYQCGQTATNTESAAEVIEAEPSPEPDSIGAAKSKVIERYGAGNVNPVEWMEASIPGRNEAEQLAFLRLAWHTRSARLAAAPPFASTTNALAAVENELGRSIAYDQSMSAEIERILTVLSCAK